MKRALYINYLFGAGTFAIISSTLRAIGYLPPMASSFPEMAWGVTLALSLFLGVKPLIGFVKSLASKKTKGKNGPETTF